MFSRTPLVVLTISIVACALWKGQTGPESALRPDLTSPSRTTAKARNVTFTVDPSIEPSSDQLTKETLPLIIGKRKVIWTSTPPLPRLQGRLLDGKPIHGFLHAVHTSFAYHLPLALKPDHIWLLIVQGLSAHVNSDPEALRSKLVLHKEGKAKIVIRDDLLIEDPSRWGEVINAIVEKASHNLTETSKRLAGSCRFSASTHDEVVVCQGAFLETVSAFFEIIVETLCGIPSITLEGELSDWIKLRKDVELLRELGMDQWVDDLVPALDLFVRSFEGNGVLSDADAKLWQSFYKFRSESGGSHMSGWILRFFPYIGAGEELRREPYVDQRGYGHEDIPVSVSQVDFLWSTFVGAKEMRLLSGFVSATQDEAGVVRPEVGYGIVETDDH